MTRYNESDLDDGLSWKQGKNSDGSQQQPRMHLNGKPVYEKQEESRGFFGNRFFNRADKYDPETGRNSARNTLKDSEKTGGVFDDTSKKTVKGGEEQPGLGVGVRDFTNNVTGKKGKVGGKGAVKKYGPVGIILSAFVTFLGGSYLAQSAMPFSLISQFQANFDSIGTAFKVRTNKFLKAQTNPDTRVGLSNNVKDFVSSHSKIYQFWKRNDNDYFKISTRQKQKLASAGINVETDDLTGQSVLKFTGSDNVELTIVADARLADASSNRFFIDDIYQTNAEFRTSYFNGARRWRGAVGAWFDGITTKFLNYLGVERGVWAAYKEGGDSAENMEKFRHTVEKNADDGGISGKADTDEYSREENEETGESSRVNTGKDTDELKVEKGSTRQQVSENAKNFVNSKVTKLLDKAGTVASLTCMAADVVGAINLIVMGYQTMQIVKVASSIFEGIQKGQMVSSDSAPVNEIGNSLTARGDIQYQLADAANTKDQSSSSDGSGSVVLKETTSKKSAMESDGVRAIFGDRPLNPNDPSVQTFNIQNSINAIAAAFGSSVTAYRACTFAKLGAAAVQGAVEAAKIIGCIASVGIGCLVDAFIDVAKGIGEQIAKSLITNIVVSAMVPFIANIAMRTIATQVFGEDLGNALVSGANIYMGENDLYAGGSGASEKSLANFRMAQAEYVNDIARHERETRSPLDYTSQYTFLGTLVTKFFIPITINTGGLVGKLNSFSNVIGKSVSSLMPNATAVDATISAREAAQYTEDNCPSVADIGGVADGFCNIYVISDMSTMELDPAEVVYKVSQLDGRNFDLSSSDTDVPVINERSRLGNYIVYCGQRQSQFGVADQNIANTFKTLTTNSTIGDTVIGAIPVIGSLTDIYNEGNVIANFGYVSGESCITGNDVAVQATSLADGSGDSIETSDWSENKYYQRFIQDQRLAESMGIVEKSSVTAFLEKYYENHPIDNSFEGMLARRSGLTKENVIATLDIIDAIAFTQSYEPDGYAPLNYSEPTAERISFEDTDNNGIDFDLIATLLRSDDTRDRRIKNFAV